MQTCDCQHNIVRFARIPDDVKPLEYADSSGNLIDPDWLTITHNKLGVACHGGSKSIHGSWSMEYTRDDGSVITWNEFDTIEGAIETARRWHSIDPLAWLDCMLPDTDDARPWQAEPLQ